jgi:hypothetical protein
MEPTFRDETRPLPNYELTITSKALAFLAEYKEMHFPNQEMAIILADLHSIGSVMTIELHQFADFENNSHFRVIFPKGYKEYPYAVFVDTQMETEGYLIERMVIDLRITTTGQTALEFKNPEFESISL